jgi:hypothetical protein
MRHSAFAGAPVTIAESRQPASAISFSALHGLGLGRRRRSRRTASRRRAAGPAPLPRRAG